MLQIDKGGSWRRTGKISGTEIHRRAVRREIILPFVGGLLLIIVLVVIAAVEGETPTSGVANTMLTVLILCPMALCLLPIYLLLVVAVVGMNRAHDCSPSRCADSKTLSLTLRERTYQPV